MGDSATPPTTLRRRSERLLASTDAKPGRDGYLGEVLSSARPAGRGTCATGRRRSARRWRRRRSSSGRRPAYLAEMSVLKLASQEVNSFSWAGI
jgi:hypothetical protein